MDRRRPGRYPYTPTRTLCLRLFLSVYHGGPFHDDDLGTTSPVVVLFSLFQRGVGRRGEGQKVRGNLRGSPYYMVLPWTVPLVLPTPRVAVFSVTSTQTRLLNISVVSVYESRVSKRFICKQLPVHESIRSENRNFSTSIYSFHISFDASPEPLT